MITAPLPSDLKKFRESMGLTAKDFAARINTPLQTYQKWEQGQRRVPGFMAFALESLRKDVNDA